MTEHNSLGWETTIFAKTLSPQVIRERVEISRLGEIACREIVELTKADDSSDFRFRNLCEIRSIVDQMIRTFERREL